MAWYDEDSWATALFAPTPQMIGITLLVAILLPILIHTLLYKSVAKAAAIPRFLLLGPSGSGKTGFAVLTENNTTTQTHTSTAPSTVSALLPEPHTPASAHFRSAGDPAYERARRFELHDTPGHAKLRHFATSQLTSTSLNSLRGIIFVVDAAAIAEDAGLTDAASYLHDVLLALQKRYTSATTSKGPTEVPVLIAANKMDLFTALPESLLAKKLEQGITSVRENRAKALREGKVLGGEGEEEEEEREWLGDGGEAPFQFEMMREVGCSVQVVGGHVLSGKEKGDVNGWLAWIAELL